MHLAGSTVTAGEYLCVCDCLFVYVNLAPSLGVYCFFVVDCACLSVTDKLQIDSSFLFLDGIELYFGRQFSMRHSTKRCSSIFDLGP